MKSYLYLQTAKTRRKADFLGPSKVHAGVLHGRVTRKKGICVGINALVFYPNMGEYNSSAGLHSRNYLFKANTVFDASVLSVIRDINIALLQVKRDRFRLALTSLQYTFGIR